MTRNKLTRRATKPTAPPPNQTMLRLHVEPLYMHKRQRKFFKVIEKSITPFGSRKDEDINIRLSVECLKVRQTESAEAIREVKQCAHSAKSVFITWEKCEMASVILSSWSCWYALSGQSLGSPPVLNYPEYTLIYERKVYPAKKEALIQKPCHCQLMSLSLALA